jgi:hypothetical protein
LSLTKNFKNKDFIYFESHIKLFLPRKSDNQELRSLCKKAGFHWSRNVFKYLPESDTNIQMITFRRYNSTLEWFKSAIYIMAFKLTELNVLFDKDIEIEECIYDTNINVDNDWLPQKDEDTLFFDTLFFDKLIIDRLILDLCEII